MKRKLISLLCVCLLAFSLGGCKVEKKKIAYTVYPLGYLVNRLAGDMVDSYSLQNEAIIQRAQMTEDYKEKITQADLILHIGQLEPYLSQHLPQIRSGKINMIDLSGLNSIYKFKRYTRVNANGVEEYIESPYYKGEMFDSIDTNEKDLFLWMDPIAMTSMAKEIRDWLIHGYAEQTKTFEENFNKLEGDLIRLDAEFQAFSQEMKRDGNTVKFVSMTASFGNWQKAYGIEVYPVILSKYGVLPNAAQLEVIKTTIRQQGVRFIAYEPNMTDDMKVLFEQLEKELELTRVNLSNLSSINETQKKENMDYLSIMYENLNTLETMMQPSN